MYMYAYIYRTWERRRESEREIDHLNQFQYMRTHMYIYIYTYIYIYIWICLYRDKDICIYAWCWTKTSERCFRVFLKVLLALSGLFYLRFPPHVPPRFLSVFWALLSCFLNVFCMFFERFLGPSGPGMKTLHFFQNRHILISSHKETWGQQI